MANKCNISLEFILDAQPKRDNLIVFVLAIIFLLGVMGNGSIIWLFFKERKLRDINNAFIINLAFSDILLLMWFVPSSIFESFFYFRPFGNVFCYILTIVTFSSHDVSILSLVVLSYIRYRAVVHPLDSYTSDQVPQTIVTCLMIWCIAISMAIFPALQCEETCIDELVIPVHWINIETFTVAMSTFHMIRFVAFYIIPLVLLCILYSVIAYKLLTGGELLQRNNTNSARKARNSRHRLGIIVIALILIFAVGWLPRYVQIMMAFSGEYNVTFNHAVNIFMALGSSLNPFALYAASSSFRMYFRRDILLCLSTIKKSETTQHIPLPMQRNSVHNSKSRCPYKTQKTIVTFQERSIGQRQGGSV